MSLLERTKLIPDENLYTGPLEGSRLESIIEEGIRSTFGMRERDALILRLARELHNAQAEGASADELSRKLKGLQLENGRLRAQIGRAE